jgi:hypothetical protein
MTIPGTRDPSPMLFLCLFQQCNVAEFLNHSRTRRSVCGTFLLLWTEANCVIFDQTICVLLILLLLVLLLLLLLLLLLVCLLLYFVRHFSTFLTRLAVHYLSTSHKQLDLKKQLLNIKRVFWFSLQLLSETFFVLRRIERDVIRIVYWSSCKEPIILVLKWTLNHKPNFMAELNNVLQWSLSVFTWYFCNLVSS